MMHTSFFLDSLLKLITDLSPYSHPDGIGIDSSGSLDTAEKTGF